MGQLNIQLEYLLVTLYGTAEYPVRIFVGHPLWDSWTSSQSACLAPFMGQLNIQLEYLLGTHYRAACEADILGGNKNKCTIYLNVQVSYRYIPFQSIYVCGPSSPTLLQIWNQ